MTPLTPKIIEEMSIPEPNSGCWLWLGPIGARGYGRIRYDGIPHFIAHRASWIAHHGPIPEGLHCCHKCDNPMCVNPSHLFLGTPADNARDKVQKGRARGGSHKGTANPASKLTEAQVLEIFHSRESLRKTAKRYGVSNGVVHVIRKGATWTHITKPGVSTDSMEDQS